MTQKSLSGHHRITLSGYIFATKARVDNRKKNLLSGNIFSTCPHNTVNFDPLTAEIHSGVWGTGTPANCNGFRVLAALLYGTLVVGVSQTLRHWTEGTTYIRTAAITLGIGPHSSCLIERTRSHWQIIVNWIELPFSDLNKNMNFDILLIVTESIKSLLQH